MRGGTLAPLRGEIEGPELSPLPPFMPRARRPEYSNSHALCAPRPVPSGRSTNTECPRDPQRPKLSITHLQLKVVGPPGRVLTSHDSHNPVGETTDPEMHRSARKHCREGHRLRRRRFGSGLLLALLGAAQALRHLLLQTQALWESGKSPGVMRNAEIQIVLLRVVHRCVAAWSPWFVPRCIFIFRYIR